MRYVCSLLAIIGCSFGAEHPIGSMRDLDTIPPIWGQTPDEISLSKRASPVAGKDGGGGAGDKPGQPLPKPTLSPPAQLIPGF